MPKTIVPFLPNVLSALDLPKSSRRTPNHKTSMSACEKAVTPIAKEFVVIIDFSLSNNEITITL